MAATFNWSIATCERNMADGGVTMVHWRCDASETVGTGDDAVTHHASSYGTQGLTPDPADAGFVAYDSLTEDAVIAWVQEALDTEALEASLDADLAEQASPSVTVGTPW